MVAEIAGSPVVPDPPPGERQHVVLADTNEVLAAHFPELQKLAAVRRRFTPLKSVILGSVMTSAGHEFSSSLELIQELRRPGAAAVS